MKCKHCGNENKRKSLYCSRGCFMKGEWAKKHPTYMKQWSLNNIDKIHQTNKEWYQNNKERHTTTVNIFKKNNPTYMDEWHIKNPGYKETYRKDWYNNNKGYMKDYSKQHLERSRVINKMRYQNDINYKISRIIRARIKDALIRGHKSLSTMQYLGCSIEFFKQHIERLMLPQMSWGNYGKEWEIDHINPIFIFDLSDIKQQKQAFNWSNQRPLWKTSEIARKHGYNIIGNRNREKTIRVKNE